MPLGPSFFTLATQEPPMKVRSRVVSQTYQNELT
jgi:hypothetical protein